MKKTIAIIFALILLNSLSVYAQDSDFSRIRYMGTSIFSLPTAATRSTFSYINDGGHSATLLSQAFWDNSIEVSMLRHMSGVEKDKNILNFKLQIIEEGEIIPAIAWGNADINTQLGSKISYVAATKHFDVFGVVAHAGMYKHPETRDQEPYFGLEKMVFPLIYIAAERTEDVNTFGIKLSPYPGLNLEIAQRDGSEEIYNLVYFRSF